MDHTIIIPTKNRTSWLFFALMCLEKFNYKGKVVILDGSDETDHKINNQNFEKFKSSLNLKTHQENDSKGSRNKRINLSKYNFFKNNIETNYFTVMNDDDCFFPNFAKYGIEFLERNSDFSAITGIEINNIVDNQFKITSSFNKVYPEFLSEDPLDRILYYATEQNQTLPFFGVCRTNMMNELFQFEKEYNFKPFCREKTQDLYCYDGEMTWVLHILLNGKVKVSTDHLMLFRNRHDALDRDSNLRYQKNHIASRGPLELIKNNTLGVFIKEHLLELSFLIKHKTKYDDEIVESVFNRIIWKFIARVSGSGLHSEMTDYNKQLKDYRNSFKKITLSVPKIDKIFSAHFLNQILNKISKFILNIKINIMVKRNFYRYKNLMKNFDKF